MSSSRGKMRAEHCADMLKTHLETSERCAVIRSVRIPNLSGAAGPLLFAIPRLDLGTSLRHNVSVIIALPRSTQPYKL